ncbi:MAG: RagB/SusD family nutrient uptake outer membrane protein [Bacteroidales bacterium]|nr:RagB/SusD family nutrient uptake outer membrane protein [Bacteroidales bacterium]
MKKIFSNTLFVLAAAGLLLASCSKDFLETKPTNQVSEGDIMSTTESALMNINGMHRLLHNCNTDWYSQGGYPTFCLHLAALSDDFIFTYTNAMFQQTQQYVHHRDLTHKYMDCNLYWKLFYRIIANGNRILSYIDDLPGDNNQRAFVKGQALAYRAFLHFQLVQAYAERYDAAGNNTQMGVPLRIEDNDDNLPRSSVEDVYTQILKDIDAAIAELESTTYKKHNKSHIDQWVAKGIKARVLLTMGKWADAATVAQDVIDHSGAALDPTTYTDGMAENRFGEMKNTEWLWACASSRTDQSQFGGKLRSWHDFISNNAASYNANSPRAINCLLYNTIPATDIRKGMWLPDPYTVTCYVNASGKKAPYMSQKWLVDDPVTKYEERDVPYMRLPEIMLIAAEGYARSGVAANVTKAQQLVYQLGHDRDPGFAAVTETGDALIEKIMWQRRVELWAEAGLRWLDLKRLNLPCDRGPAPREGYNQGPWKNSATAAPTNLDPLASNYNMYGADLGEEARVIPAGDKRWQWLIPEQELSSNPLMVQNPK